MFVIGEAAIRVRPTVELQQVERFDAVEDLSTSISTDVVKVAHGSYILELTRELWPPEVEDRALFALCCDGLRALAQTPAGPGMLRAYEMKLLHAVGLLPNLDTCTDCGKPIDPNRVDSLAISFSGAICESCPHNGIGLTAKAWNYLRALQGCSLFEAPAITVDSAERREVRDVMLRIVHHHVGKELQTLSVIRQLGT